MIWGSFWEPFGFNFPLVFHLKNHRFFDVFWGAFWMDFGGPDPRKWSSRVHETLIFEKSPFSFWYRFLLNFGLQKPPKRGLKLTPNRENIASRMRLLSTSLFTTIVKHLLCYLLIDFLLQKRWESASKFARHMFIAFLKIKKNILFLHVFLEVSIIAARFANR